MHINCCKTYVSISPAYRYAIKRLHSFSMRVLPTNKDSMCCVGAVDVDALIAGKLHFLYQCVLWYILVTVYRLGVSKSLSSTTRHVLKDKAADRDINMWA